MRSKDFLNRYHIKKALNTALEDIGGASGVGFERRGELRWQVVVEGAGANNSIQPYGKLKEQAAWVAIGAALTGAIAGASTAVDVKNFDFVKFVPTYLHSLGQTVQIQTLTPAAPPDAGDYTIRFILNGVTLTTASIAWNATAGQIQTAIRLLAGLENVTVAGTMATAVVITMAGVIVNMAVVTNPVNTLTLLGVAKAIVPTISTPFVAGAEINLIASSFWD